VVLGLVLVHVVLVKFAPGSYGMSCPFGLAGHYVQSRNRAGIAAELSHLLAVGPTGHSMPLYASDIMFIIGHFLFVVSRRE
jgi:hypothetical protein